MAKKVTAVVRLHLKGGQASPAPPVGPTLSQHKINMMQFIKEYNERTAKDNGAVIPAEITVYADTSFTFILKSPPASQLIKKELGLEKASSEPGMDTVAFITEDQIKRIAEQKMTDLNVQDLDSAVKILAGTARSMGIVLKGSEQDVGQEITSPEESAANAAAREEAEAAADAAHQAAQQAAPEPPAQEQPEGAEEDQKEEQAEEQKDG